MNKCKAAYFVVSGVRYDTVIDSIFGSHERNFSSKKAADKDFSYTYNIVDVVNKYLYFSIGFYPKQYNDGSGIINQDNISLKSANLFFNFKNPDNIIFETNVLESKYGIVAKKLIGNDIMPDGNIYVVKGFVDFHVKLIDDNKIGIQELNYLREPSAYVAALEKYTYNNTTSSLYTILLIVILVILFLTCINILR